MKIERRFLRSRMEEETLVWWGGVVAIEAAAWT
jgi:hypothetical protein